MLPIFVRGVNTARAGSGRRVSSHHPSIVELLPQTMISRGCVVVWLDKQKRDSSENKALSISVIYAALAPHHWETCFGRAARLSPTETVPADKRAHKGLLDQVQKGVLVHIQCITTGSHLHASTVHRSVAKMNGKGYASRSRNDIEARGPLGRLVLLISIEGTVVHFHRDTVGCVTHPKCSHINQDHYLPD
ncbi:hypothetical protein TNCV_5051441 [Trichonephila clavipes]|nr:hypothetical protein TNCV_5051441 [Trichonephila clavipes]